MNAQRILVIDDERSMRDMLELFLIGEGYKVTLANDGRGGIDCLKINTFDLVLTDLKMPNAGGLDVLEFVKTTNPSTQVILLTAFGTHLTALGAMAEGAFDFIEKPFKMDELKFQIERALRVSELASNQIHPKGDEIGFLPIPMVGRSPAINRVFDVIRKVAQAPTSVLITGESGTGKELAARAIHEFSNRAKGPFVVINCGAIPENLMESELFGYSAGAFTGAVGAKLGLIPSAQGGTLMLDEIGELPQHMQVKILRTIQERKVLAVGSVEEIHVDVRFITATNQNLEKMVRRGTFREDLYYRLNVVEVQMPPLRDRREDIPLLAGYFLRRFSQQTGKTIRAMEKETLDALLQFPFPGNVRELENIIERAVAFETRDVLSIDHLPPHVLRGHGLGHGPLPAEISLPPEGMDLEETLASIERNLMSDALRRTSGNQTDAAELLGISFRSIRYKIQKYGIDLGDI